MNTPTIQGFLVFAETKSGFYSYFSNFNCALSQYLKSLGHEKVWVGGKEVMLDGFEQTPLIEYIDQDVKNTPTEKVKPFETLFNIPPAQAQKLETALQVGYWEDLAEVLRTMKVAIDG